MDEASQKVFDEIVVKEPEALTEAEADILRARRSYLTEEQAKKFADLLGDAKPEKQRGKKEVSE